MGFRLGPETLNLIFLRSVDFQIALFCLKQSDISMNAAISPSLDFGYEALSIIEFH